MTGMTTSQEDSKTNLSSVVFSDSEQADKHLYIIN